MSNHAIHWIFLVLIFALLAVILIIYIKRKGIEKLKSRKKILEENIEGSEKITIEKATNIEILKSKEKILEENVKSLNTDISKNQKTNNKLEKNIKDTEGRGIRMKQATDRLRRDTDRMLREYERRYGQPFVLRNGYICFKHSYSDKKKRGKPFHRWWYKKKKGKIKTGYEIHHKDGDKTNNDINNLEQISIERHEKIHGLRDKK